MSRDHRMFNIVHNAIYNHISSFTSFLFHSQMTITSLKCIKQPVHCHLLAGHSLNAVMNNAKLKHMYKVFSKLMSSFPHYFSALPPLRIAHASTVQPEGMLHIRLLLT